MQQKKKIIQLFEKLISNSTSSNEKEQLSQYINTEKDKDLILEWLKENWDKVEYDQLTLSSKELLDQIHQRIKVENTDSNKKTRKLKIRRVVLNTIKYAAVVLVACGIQWYILTQMGNDPDILPMTQATNYNEITVPNGSKSFIVLSDSTKVWLNAGAKLKYPSNFEKDSRSVFLEGEAFFDVSKNEDMPFFVNMAGVNIKVLGTQFNVKAYSDEERIETTLLEGSIEVIGLKSDKDIEGNLKLEPGQKLILFKGKNYSEVKESTKKTADIRQEDFIIKPIKIERAEVISLLDTEPEISWKKDKLIFNKERFEVVKIKLERWYGVTIDVKDPKILDYRFTGTFDKETFEQALLALKQAANFNYTIKKKQVVIKQI